ncbi:hypothetical protein EFR84_30020 [Rhizobium chutanense]|uniref:Uncharacterized protein n=1 Tax=Rhizobium chutanense TaxID=2035448 RepID=A0A3S0Q0U8_9HYPH|nr:hypothetical protein EFR84_30020 [Rhizobium chutanense]
MPIPGGIKSRYRRLQTRCGSCPGEAVVAVTVVKRRRLQRRASFRTHKGRSNTFNPHIVLSENRFRFSGRMR